MSSHEEEERMDIWRVFLPDVKNDEYEYLEQNSKILLHDLQDCSFNLKKTQMELERMKKRVELLMSDNKNLQEIVNYFEIDTKKTLSLIKEKTIKDLSLDEYNSCIKSPQMFYNFLAPSLIPEPESLSSSSAISSDASSTEEFPHDEMERESMNNAKISENKDGVNEIHPNNSLSVGITDQRIKHRKKSKHKHKKKTK